MSTRGAWVTCALGVVLALGVQAQQPSFRASTEMVVVDVSVVGEDGAPVKGLQESDFAVRIDGQPRRVLSLKFVDDSMLPGPAAAPGGGRVSTNASEATGRLILILVDEGSIAFGGLRAAAGSIDRLLAGFGPADKVALATLPGPRMRVDFTLDRARIAAAIKEIPAGAGPTTVPGLVNVAPWEAFAIERGDAIVREEVALRECGPIEDDTNSASCTRTIEMDARNVAADERNRAGQFVSGLRSLLRALAAVDAPKLVIVFSEGLAAPEAATELAGFGPLATAARATIFAMRLDRSLFEGPARRNRAFSLMSGYERMSFTAALEALAGAARGTALEILNDADRPFTRLARELSGYYLLGVESDRRDRDGRLHQIRVDVDRPGVTVRARREVAARAVVKDEKRMLAQVLASPLMVADIPLRVATFNMADEDPGSVRVLIVAEVDREQPRDAPAMVDVVFTDDKGKTTGGTPQRMTLPRLESGALSLMFHASLAPGAYTMKLGVARAGLMGSVEHRLVARLTEPALPAGGAVTGLQLGELVVTAPAAGDRMVPVLDGLVSGDRVLSFVQVGIGLPAREDVSFVFDVVKEEAGPALLSAAGEVVGRPKGRSRAAEATLDARLLPPGDYGVRLNVHAAGGKVASLFTPFRLERPRGPAGGPAAAAAARGASTARAADRPRFTREDALDPMVVGPFFEEVARLAPATSRPALELARSGRIDEAVRLLEPGSAGDPALPFLRGLSLFEKGDLQPASNQFRAAIAESPELFVGAFYLGACYAAGGRDAQAIGAWQTSLAGLGRYPAVYRFLSDALMRTGQPERARQLLADAAARWPDEEAFRARVVRASVEAGRYQQALDYADQVIASQPTDSSVLFLAMRSAFQALMEGADIAPPLLLERLRRYRALYVAAGGLQQALVEEWVRFAEARAKGLQPAG